MVRKVALQVKERDVPILFNLVGDVLTRMVKRALEKGHIKGVLGSFVPGNLMTLQHADDTLLFSSCEGSKLRNLKIVLMLFDKVSGMRVNFNMSDFIPMNMDDFQIHEVAPILNCPMGSLPFKY
jgi:hypothetical protein